MHSTADKRLFWASFLTLIAAGIGFSIRGAILGDWSKQFGFTQGELGNITGGGLVGFGITIIALSFFADRVGYGPLMILAFLLHTASAVVTLAATPIFDAYGKEATFQCLYWGMFLFALGNGTCEAVINPLTATLFPENKTHWLNILHAGWPGGLILGAVMGLIFEATKTRWEIQMGVFLVPTLMYGLLMLGQPFPRSEAKSAGITLEGMMQELGLLGAGVASLLLGLWLTQSAADLRLPSFLGWVVAAVLLLIFGYFSSFRLGHWMLAFLLVLHAMVGYVELGTDSWITNITGTILENKTYGLLLFIWTSGLMFALRFFAGPIVHQISPLGLLFGSAVLGAIGLALLGSVSGALLLIVAATIYGLGKTFYWPTMLGVVSERYPRGGALTLGTIGGVGMLSAGLLGSPGIGYKQDYAASHYLQDNAPATYQRYKSDDENRFLFFAPISGLDGAKVGTLLGDPGENNGDGKKLAQDIANLQQAGRQLSEVKSLEKLNSWWQANKVYADQDKGPLEQARLHGGRQALIWTAGVPAAMAVGFLLLILYFRTQGGYQQVHIGGDVHEKKTLASEYPAGGDKHPGGLGSEAIQAPGGIKPAT
jgi:MFS family permease